MLQLLYGEREYGLNFQFVIDCRIKGFDERTEFSLKQKFLGERNEKYAMKIYQCGLRKAINLSM